MIIAWTFGFIHRRCAICTLYPRWSVGHEESQALLPNISWATNTTALLHVYASTHCWRPITRFQSPRSGVPALANIFLLHRCEVKIPPDLFSTLYRSELSHGGCLERPPFKDDEGDASPRVSDRGPVVSISPMGHILSATLDGKKTGYLCAPTVHFSCCVRHSVTVLSCS